VALVRTDVSEEPGASFIREPHGVTTQKTTFFIVTAVKISNLTSNNMHFSFVLTSKMLSLKPKVL
jgi:hypothetical protein